MTTGDTSPATASVLGGPGGDATKPDVQRSQSNTTWIQGDTALQMSSDAGGVQGPDVKKGRQLRRNVQPPERYM